MTAATSSASTERYINAALPEMTTFTTWVPITKIVEYLTSCSAVGISVSRLEVNVIRLRMPSSMANDCSS